MAFNEVAGFTGSTTLAPGSTITVVQPTGTLLHVVIDGGTITPSGTQAVAGTVALSGGTIDAILQVGTANVGNTNPVPVFPSTQGFASGAVTTTGTATTSVIAAVASNRIYIDAYSVVNSGTVAATVAFQDGSGGATLWTVIAPAGGGSNNAGSIMFRTTAGNALFAAASAASTTISISAAGFSSTL